MNNTMGSSIYRYDPFGELTSYTAGTGKTVNYSYDQAGNTTAITYPLGDGDTWAKSGTVNYAYDDADEMTGLTDFNGHTITIKNTADGLPNPKRSERAETRSSQATTRQTRPPTSSSCRRHQRRQLQRHNPPRVQLQRRALRRDQRRNRHSVIRQRASRLQLRRPKPGHRDDPRHRARATATPSTPPGTCTTLPTGASGTSYDNASELTAPTLSGTTTSYSYNDDGERNRRSRRRNRHRVRRLQRRTRPHQLHTTAPPT